MSPHAASDLCVCSLSLSTIHKVVQFLQVLQRNSNVRLLKLVPSLHILHVKPWVTLYLEFLSKPITWEQTMETIDLDVSYPITGACENSRKKVCTPRLSFFCEILTFQLFFKPLWLDMLRHYKDFLSAL